jgi:isoquinoline 1-oxidoreductase subunit beta
MEQTPIMPELPCAWWRGTGATQTQVANECLMDELASVVKRDPLAFRLAHLTSNAPRTFTISKGNTATYEPQRMRRTLTEVAKRSRWKGRGNKTRAYGIACGFYDCPNTYTAVVAELTTNAQEGVKVARITIATDAGLIVNPTGAIAQLQSNAVFAIGAALYEQISVEDGEIVQRNFADFKLPRMNEIPLIDCVLIPSKEAPSGLGEPATPTVMAAIANAYAALTGKPVRRFPLLQSQDG